MATRWGVPRDRADFDAFSEAVKNRSAFMGLAAPIDTWDRPAD